MKSTLISVNSGVASLECGLTDAGECCAEVEVFKRVDPDGNGRRSRQEVACERSRRFMLLQVDRHGMVSVDEMHHGVGVRAAKRFEKLDANGNGGIGPDEFDDNAARRFQRLDGHGDGAVTREEKRQGLLGASD